MPKIKIAVTADLHIGWNQKYPCAAWDALVKDAENQSAERILIAGDIFECPEIGYRNRTTGSNYDSFAKPLLNRWGKETVHVVLGNHDDPGPRDKNALTVLEPIVAVHSEPGIARLAPGMMLACLPWQNKARVMAGSACNHIDTDLGFTAHVEGILSDLRGQITAAPDEFWILLGHCGIVGRDMGFGRAAIGGTFDLIEGQLDLGQNLTLLGHFHQRDELFVGAPWQQGFKFAGQDTGYQLIIIDTEAKTYTREIREVPAPKYFIVNSADGVILGTGCTDDFVRYEGEEPPKDGLLPVVLPPGHEFVKKAEKKEIEYRQGFKPGSSDYDMLAEWCKRQEKPAPALETFGEVSGAGQAGLNAQAGFDRLLEVKLQGIGPHGNTDIDLSCDDIIGICGDNGSGKTFLLEAVMAALYGFFPSRSGSLYQFCSAAEGTLEITFNSGEFNYRAKRLLLVSGKTQKQEAYLFRYRNDKAGKEEPVAGPKVTDFEAAILELLGPADLFLASAFGAQDGSGDLIKMQAAGRQELYARMLNLGRFAEINSQAGDKYKAAKIQADTEERVMAGAQAVENPEAELDAAKEADTDAALESLEAEVALEKANKALEPVKAERDGILRAKDEVLKISQALQGITSRQQLADKEIQELKKLEAELPEAVKALAGAEGAKAQVDSYNAAAGESAPKRLRIKAIDGEIESLQAQITREKDSIIANLEKGRALIKIAGDKVDMISKAGCAPDIIFDCPFLEDAKSNIARKEKMEADADSLEARLSEGDYGKAIKPVIALLLQEKDMLEEGLPAEIEKPDEGTMKLGIDYPALLAIKQVKEEHLKALPDLESRLVQIGEEEKAKQVEYREKQDLLDGLGFITEKLAKLEAEAQGAVNHARLCRAQKEATIKILATAEAALKQYQEQGTERERLQKSISENRARASVFEVIAAAFGKSGIPQEIIDSSLPQVQAILDTLTGKISDTFRIELSTLRDLKGGGKRETLDILVTTDTGTRPVESCSGGEQKLTSTLMRLAISAFLVERNFGRIKVIWLDEAFDALDDINKQRLLEVLTGAKGFFQQIILVSHDNAILQGLPRLISVEKGKMI